MKSNPTPAISLPADCVIPGITHFKKVKCQPVALETGDVARPSNELCDPLCTSALKKHATGTGAASLFMG